MGSIISEDPDSGPIVRVEYWERFRNVMDKLDEADENSKTAMMVSWLQRLDVQILMKRYLHEVELRRLPGFNFNR